MNHSDAAPPPSAPNDDPGCWNASASSTDGKLFRPVVVTPTYNNAATLADVVERTLALSLPVIAVNDGSSDSTAKVLAALAQSHGAQFHFVSHAKNRGKAAALQSGFAAARARGFTHAVTMDTDGQLDAEDIPGLLEVAQRRPSVMVVGCRDDRAADYPARSRTGRRFSNLCVRLQTGKDVGDTQCGLRIYPLVLVEDVRCTLGRFAFETEIITRALWRGWDVESLPVRCRYFAQDKRITHFRPWLDSLHAVWMHARLFGRALLPTTHVRTRTASPAPSRWRAMLGWVNPRSLWWQLRSDGVERSSAAAGVAIGVFIANLPIYGLQTLASVYVARRLNLHPLAVVLGSNISAPPMSAVLIVLAVNVGFVLTHGRLPALADFDPAVIEPWPLVARLLLEWWVGGVVVGTVLGAATFVFVNALVRRLPSPATESAVDRPTDEMVQARQGNAAIDGTLKEVV